MRVGHPVFPASQIELEELGDGAVERGSRPVPVIDLVQYEHVWTHTSDNRSGRGELRIRPPTVGVHLRELGCIELLDVERGDPNRVDAQRVPESCIIGRAGSATGGQPPQEATARKPASPRGPPVGGQPARSASSRSDDRRLSRTLHSGPPCCGVPFTAGAPGFGAARSRAGAAGRPTRPGTAHTNTRPLARVGNPLRCSPYCLIAPSPRRDT